MTRDPQARHLSAVKVRALLASGGQAHDPDLSRQLMCTAYILSGGESLLVFETGRGILYPSRDELARRYYAQVARVKEQNLESSVIDQPETFVARVAELERALPRLIGMPDVLVDRCRESQDAVDRAVRKLPRDRILDAKLFSALAAYVGEIVRELTGGQWVTETTPNGGIVPRVVDATGIRFEPGRLYKEYLEYGPRASIRAFVAGTTSGPHS